MRGKDFFAPQTRARWVAGPHAALLRRGKFKNGRAKRGGSGHDMRGNGRAGAQHSPHADGPRPEIA